MIKYPRKIIQPRDHVTRGNHGYPQLLFFFHKHGHEPAWGGKCKVGKWHIWHLYLFLSRTCSGVIMLLRAPKLLLDKEFYLYPRPLKLSPTMETQFYVLRELKSEHCRVPESLTHYSFQEQKSRIGFWGIRKVFLSSHSYLQMSKSLHFNRFPNTYGLQVLEDSQLWKFFWIRPISSWHFDGLHHMVSSLPTSFLIHASWGINLISRVGPAESNPVTAVLSLLLWWMSQRWAS